MKRGTPRHALLLTALVCAGMGLARMLRGPSESSPPIDAAQPNPARDAGQAQASSPGPQGELGSPESAAEALAGAERASGRRDALLAKEPELLGLEEGGGAQAQVLLPNWTAKYAERTAAELEPALNALRLELAELARAASRGDESAQAQHAELQAEARWLTERLSELRARSSAEATETRGAR